MDCIAYFGPKSEGLEYFVNEGPRNLVICLVLVQLEQDTFLFLELTIFHANHKYQNVIKYASPFYKPVLIRRDNLC